MQLLSILACFSMYFQPSFWTTLLASKPEPVDLEYKCIEISDDPNNKEFKHDDVPIILLHGMLFNKDTWNQVSEVIGGNTKKKVCAADLRNHGQSPWNDEEYDVAAMTEDVKHLIDRIQAPKAIVIGHSLGGKIAVHLALNYPEKVEKIIVEEMRANGVNPVALKEGLPLCRFMKEVEHHIPQGVTETEANEEVLTLFRDYFAKMNIPFQLDDFNFTFVKCFNGKCQLNTNPALLDVSLRNFNELLNESSGRFDGPALFIYGAGSSLKVGEDESNIKKLFPNAKLVSVEGGDHFVHNSEIFRREVIKFINNK